MEGIAQQVGRNCGLRDAREMFSGKSGLKTRPSCVARRLAPWFHNRKNYGGGNRGPFKLKEKLGAG